MTRFAALSKSKLLIDFQKKRGLFTMRVIVVKDYDAMSQEAFRLMKATLTEKKDAVLGLATGSTPIGLYREMIADYRAGGTSYRDVRTFNLDEYVGLDVSSDQSYVYFMRKNLFDHIDVLPENTNIENGTFATVYMTAKKADDADAYYIVYEENGKLIIVDFKTDRASNGDELAGRYKEQLSVYSRCLSEVLGLSVKHTVIYSFSLGKTIEIIQE